MLSPCYCTALCTNSSTAFSIWDLELFVYFGIWGIFCCFGALFFLLLQHFLHVHTYGKQYLLFKNSDIISIHYRITESFRCEKTFKITKSSCKYIWVTPSRTSAVGWVSHWEGKRTNQLYSQYIIPQKSPHLCSICFVVIRDQEIKKKTPKLKCQKV